MRFVGLVNTKERNRSYLYRIQTIKLTYGAACEAIAEAFNHCDWRNDTIAEVSREILRKLGFKNG